MKNKKNIKIKSEKDIITNDLYQVYVYVRDIKKICPIPYKWEIDFKKINELKGK